MTGDHGPNLVCRCDAHVASAETDCNVLQFIALERDAVRPVTVRKRHRDTANVPANVRAGSL
jgi:hypothetical protein